MNTGKTLLVELGTEEMPPKALRALGEAFRDGIAGGLAQRDLAHGEVRWFATPRRLAVMIAEVALQGPDRETEILGPPADRARDADGNWTAAAAGFAGKQGMDPADLEIIDTPKGARLGLRRREPGASTPASLVDIIDGAVAQLPIPRRMRWGAGREEFVRPVHWVLAMLGEDSEHGVVLGHPTGRVTYGHRVHGPGPIRLGRPEDYEERLEQAGVIAGFERRRELIRAQVEAEAAALGATAVIDDDLLDEVTGLVEWPVALTGAFEQRFLDVPQEALISSMKEHQKYFHVVDGQGRLLPHFIAVANLESRDPSQVIAGNERVIRPRLADAAFFYETDCKKPLATRVDSLAQIVFQQQLGTLLDKTRRVQALAGALAPRLGAASELAERAAWLGKADLVTEMVLEFPDLQGIAGSYYARHDGEPDEVATALAQQYWPRFSGDRLPETPTACVLGLADRLDTLVGIFGIGQPPSGSRDPFALRRASLAVLRILVEKSLDLDLAEALELTARGYAPGTLEAGSEQRVLEYMLERFRAWYEEENIPVEVFRAVSARGLSRPLDIHRRVLAVHAFAQLPQAQALAAANKRVSNILDKLEPGHAFSAVDDGLLAEPAERALAGKLAEMANTAEDYLRREAYTEALGALADLREAVDTFFDEVLVNTEDSALRDNRLNLLRQLRDLFLQVADISQLVVTR